jgi:hypothetical protein
MQFFISTPCEAWWRLLDDQFYRGALYQYFFENRQTLVQHLQNCDKCKQLVSIVNPALVNTLSVVRRMSNTEFARLIRRLYIISNASRVYQ